MIIKLFERKLAALIFTVVILLSTFWPATMKVFAIDFDPFGSYESDNLSLPKDARDDGPVIPQIEFNNNDISMVFQIISDATGWSIFPTPEVSTAKVNLWAKSITAKELLDKVTQTTGFTYQRQGDIIVVMTYDEYAQHYGLAKEVVVLDNGDSDSITGVIRPFLSKLGKCVVHKETNSMVIFESKGNLKIILDIIEKLDIPSAAETILEVISLKYADAEVIAEALQKVFPDKEPIISPKLVSTEKEQTVSPDKQTGKQESVQEAAFGFASQVEVFAIGTTNQLIIKALPKDIKKLKKLIDKLDTYVEPISRNYHLTYVDAAEIYEGLEQILNLSGRSGMTQRTNVQDSRTGGIHQGITLVEATNSILVTGPPSVHSIMENIVKNIDIQGAYEEGFIRVYKIENADVEEVADSIRELIESQERQRERDRQMRFAETVAGSASQASVTAPGHPQLDGRSESREFMPHIEARVTVSRSTNAVIVKATARQHRELEKLIAELDKKRKQVLIKAIIVEVITQDELNFGIELSNISSDLFAFTSFGLSLLDPVSATRDIVVSPGGTAAVLAPDNFKAIIQALQSNGNAKVMSAPQVLVNDNAIGFINSIAEEPTLEINQGETVATTSFAGFVEAGTQFAITPHISENNYLRVEYQITLNSFAAEPSLPSIPPPRNTSSIRSEATIPDGYTIIVGGLQATNEIENIDKVPLLGDLPLIGFAFRNTSMKKEYRTTYLFITPTIMDKEDFSDLKDYSLKAQEKVALDSNDIMSQ
jgi:type II secretory pathway component GspD/PulD (secretin)